MEFIPALLGIAIIWFIGSKLYRGFKSGLRGGSSQRHCMTCGVDGDPVTVTKGSIFIEIVLWLCFLVPGLIYSIWRMTTRHQACSSCNATTLVPADSPAAINHRRLLQQPPQT